MAVVCRRWDGGKYGVQCVLIMVVLLLLQVLVHDVGQNNISMSQCGVAVLLLQVPDA
jgi:hypothetical protein